MHFPLSCMKQKCTSETKTTNCMRSTHRFQKHNFLFAIGYRNNKNTGPNHSFLWENPWQSAFRQEHTERFLLQLFFFCPFFFFLFLNKCTTEDGEVFCFFFLPQHLWNSGNQTGSNQHGCPVPCCLQDCQPSQLTPNAPAWRSCWWSLLPPSPQKKTKTSRKEDKQEIGWQTVQPQVAFNMGPKPLGNREVVTSIRVIFYFEETPQCHSHPLWKGGKAESKRQRVLTHVGG